MLCRLDLSHRLLRVRRQAEKLRGGGRKEGQERKEKQKREEGQIVKCK